VAKCPLVRTSKEGSEEVNLWAWEVTKKYKGTWKTESNFWLLFLGKV
jgi:hypothetical protein